MSQELRVRVESRESRVEGRSRELRVESRELGIKSFKARVIRLELLVGKAL
jgi:hypothetical protein